MDEVRTSWSPFKLTNVPKGFDSAGKTVRGWKIYQQVTGQDPDTTPQCTGDCVAESADDITRLMQTVQIAAGGSERFQPTYGPYHYATGRVLIGGNRLRGGAGSLGSWQADALRKYGRLRITAALPDYIQSNVDAWGDDRAAAGGVKFRDFIEAADDFPVKDTALLAEWDALRDALYSHHYATIASTCGYTMKPNKDGFHLPSGTWAHQLGIWGYSENPKHPKWVAIKNQWGSVHGEITDYETGEKWPPGFLRVPLSDFIRYHLQRQGTECIAYSGVEGFPVPRLDPTIWTRKKKRR
jgi:hypothetical protein